MKKKKKKKNKGISRHTWTLRIYHYAYKYKPKYCSCLLHSDAYIILYSALFANIQKLRFIQFLFLILFSLEATAGLTIFIWYSHYSWDGDLKFKRIVQIILIFR